MLFQLNHKKGFFLYKIGGFSCNDLSNNLTKFELYLILRETIKSLGKIAKNIFLNKDVFFV